MADIIEIVLWFFSLLAVYGAVLNVLKKESCFWVWTICNIFWLIYDIVTAQTARAILDFMNLVTSTWGIIVCLKKEKPND